MQIPRQLWCVAMVCLLGSHVSASLKDMEADNWSASTILHNVLNEHIKPYTGDLVEKVTHSQAWRVFGNTMNSVQGAINLTWESVYPYYEENLWVPTMNTLEPIVEQAEQVFKPVWNYFQKSSQ